VNDIQNKMLSGTPLADAEWETYLALVHRETQSMTPKAFGTYRTTSRQSSYEVLASVLTKKPSKDLHVLDLGCGDGYLIQYILPKLGPKGKVTGVDMVPSEIDRAKAVYTDKRVQFHVARAQDLPVPGNSVDVALCHLTLMLMRPIEPVVRKLLTVIKPGGEVAGVVSAPRQYGTPAYELAQLIGAFIDQKQPGMRKLALVDPRFDTEDGIRELMKGFKDDLWVQDFEILVPADPEAVWNFHRDMYLIGALPQPAKLELKDKIAAFVNTHKAQSPTLAIPLRLFQVTR
jgi:ubiquinone/menaquinone biosynthesis C-methylase UbiE